METSSQARPFARPDLRAGLFGLDPRTHLLAVVAFGVASIVLTGLLETALLQVAAALYLAGNGRARLALRSCASFAVVAGLSFLPLPGLYGVLFVSLLHMVPPFTAGCALFSLSPSAIMCALARWRAEAAPYVVAVDGGADVALKAHLTLDAVIGDAELMSEKAIRKASSFIVRVGGDGLAPRLRAPRSYGHRLRLCRDVRNVT